ncbi:MAG: hypothetical protein P4L42_06505 [Desulfocapsaceae bacterium]|nr:hypothetical protein [Desulfocapsaceae bacterium]
MKHIDLINVLYGIAACIEPQNHRYLALFIVETSDKVSCSAGKKFWERAQRDIDLAEQVGRAALLLSRCLNDSNPLKPRFMKLDSLKRSACGDPFAEKNGEKILSRATQRCEKELWYYFRHYNKAMDLGGDFLNQKIARDDEDNLLIPGKSGLIPTGIGFNRSQIIAFLNQTGIKHSFNTSRFKEKRRFKAAAVRVNKNKHLAKKRRKASARR